jgi:heparanase
MDTPPILALTTGLAVTGLGGAVSQPGPPARPATSLAPAIMARIGAVDERYQSYNVEMLEVTGGKFWKPYGAKPDASATSASASPKPGSDTPAGMNPDLYQYRPPIDLRRARLRKLAAGLGPAYVRISGTWANSTYFPESDKAPDVPPNGFSGVLTRLQWKDVVDFARVVDARIVTSFAISPGTRDAAGVWTPDQARRLLEYTRSLGGRVAAAEFMNEPNFAAMGGAPAGYDAAAYGRDFKAFHAFVKRAAAGLVILGPGSVGERASGGLGSVSFRLMKTRDLLVAAGPGVDAFSYHHYGAVSQRCAGAGAAMTTSPEAALSEDWLSRTDATLAFYKSLRDELEPGKPMWLTETADAACGGNAWASSFLDAFRYLDQLGRLARQGVQVVAHNTLVASDYGLLDEGDLAPKPKYWGALWWRRLMGTTVLDSGVPIRAGLHAYAHCLRGTPGGVALLLINTDRQASQTLTLPTKAERYTLAATDLLGRQVQLNGADLTLGSNDELPGLAGVPIPAGDLTLPPATITFLAVPEAGNRSCR